MSSLPGSPLTVLVADPDPAQQHLLTQCLSPRFTVLTATTLDEAARLVATRHPAVLLTELDLTGGGDVKAFIHQLRSALATKHMVIGIVTHRSAIHDKVTGFNAGADDYVVKPINLRSFMYRIVLLARTHNLAS